jgi:diguanylate cyclase (GGDEF)-like protein
VIHWNQVKVTRFSVGAVVCAVISHDDITIRRLGEDQARYNATHDALTGLYNRAFFEAECGRLALSMAPVGLVMVDIDNLKTANDTLGHEAGDDLICRASVCLKKAIRAVDAVVRLGGDEFVIILHGVAPQTLKKIVCRIKEINKEMNIDLRADQPLLGLSIGASLSSPGESLNMALQKADKEMYADKAKRKMRRVGI